MTKVLGYKTFATHGTDLGCLSSYTLYDKYNESTRAAHFPFIPFFPLTRHQLALQGIKVKTPLEQFEEERVLEWEQTGSAYFQEQATKVGNMS